MLSSPLPFGLAGAKRQAQDIADALGVPASSTSLAFLSAAHVLGLERISVAATYPEDLANASRTFLVEGGIEVVHLGCLGIWTGDEVGPVRQEDVLRFACANEHSDAQAVLIPDTDLHTAAFLHELEAEAGKIVLTANQVTMWKTCASQDT